MEFKLNQTFPVGSITTQVDKNQPRIKVIQISSNERAYIFLRGDNGEMVKI